MAGNPTGPLKRRERELKLLDFSPSNGEKNFEFPVLARSSVGRGLDSSTILFRFFRLPRIQTLHCKTPWLRLTRTGRR